MSIFSKQRTYVGTTTVPFHDEVKDTVEQSVFNSVIKDRPIGEDLSANLLSGVGSKANAYYKYGRDKYYYGLPEGTLELKYAASGTVAHIIKSELGGNYTVIMDYNFFSQANAEYFVHAWLQENRGWDKSTGVISNPPAGISGTVTLRTATWGNNSTIDIEYQNETIGSSDEPFIENVNLGLTVDPEEYYYHTAYYLEGSPEIEERQYWQYRVADETYPTLEPAGEEEVSPYFPVIPLRRDNADLPTSGQLYDDSVRMLRFFNIEYDDVVEEINENEDVDDIDHAYVQLSVGIQEDHPMAVSYLHDYFFYLYQNQVNSETEFQRWLAKDTSYRNVTTPPYNKVVVQETERDTEEKGFFNMEFSWLYITQELKTGVVGKKHEAVSETNLEDRVEYDNYAYTASTITFKKQVSTTQYSEVVVVGPHHISYIHKKKHVDTTLEDSLSEDGDNFQIPLHHSVLMGFTLPQRTDIVRTSLKLTLNSVVKQSVKWYATGLFQIAIMVIAIVITVYTWGADGGNALAMAAAITGSTNVLLNFVVTMIIYHAIGEAFTMLVNVLGIKNAFILAIISTVVALSGGIGGFDAAMALKLQAGLMTGVQANIEAEMASIMNEFDLLQAQMEEDQAELDEMIEAFPESYIDPMVFVYNTSGLASADESPEDYYNTRIHSGNIGTYAFNEANLYVENNLSLDGVTPRDGLTFNL